MGRPRKGEEHPRQDVADKIGLLAAIGTPQPQIARLLSMSLETMHRYYKDDLDLGAAKAGAVVGGKIFEAAKRGEQWACTLWAARRMGWREAHVLAGDPQAPLGVVLAKPREAMRAEDWEREHGDS
jgi:hypothetical protein